MNPFTSPPPFAPPDPGMGAPVPPAPPGLAPPGGPPQGVNNIPGAMGMAAPPYPMPMNDPASVQYANETQVDGSILLRMLNADGSPGPVLQVIPPPKQVTAKAGGGK